MIDSDAAEGKGEPGEAFASRTGVASNEGGTGGDDGMEVMEVGCGICSYFCVIIL